jgi:DNA modification methylase
MKTLAEKYITLLPGDCMDVLATLPDNSLDSCVTDPPYHLTSIVKRFKDTNENDDTITSKRVRERSDGYARLVAGGFMGKQWDGGDIAQSVELWAQVYRVLKPGAHLLAFGGTRTYHRMACAIEDAGFEIRDCIQWLYGSGFPKSHDVSKGIDRAAGAEREAVGYRVKSNNSVTSRQHKGEENGRTIDGRDAELARAYQERGGFDITAPATDSARQWQGWGTALKPACEPIVLARKPLSENTVAANVLKWGTGAINVDGCRVGTETVSTHSRGSNGAFPKRPTERSVEESGRAVDQRLGLDHSERDGRWPANVIHDGSDEVVAAFPESKAGTDNGERGTGGIWSPSSGVPCGPQYGDQGSAARFFYTAKADGDDRLGSKHPTVKPLDLMQYLVRLVTPKGGTCLDPFAGTGTTGEAAFREGMHALLIEREAEYLADIKRRIDLCNSGPDERAREAMKEKLKDKPLDSGPLFSEWDAMWSKPFHKPEYIEGNGSLSRRLETLHNLQIIEKAIESDHKQLGLWD